MNRVCGFGGLADWRCQQCSNVGLDHYDPQYFCKVLEALKILLRLVSFFYRSFDGFLVEEVTRSNVVVGCGERSMVRL